ncbi:MULTISPECIES: integrase [unclassified Actinomyces]|uniref:integrase n=1 Tax=unclassified Actinomyces TaxID=2609248 RepID=UPI000D5959B4|nr:MULTISPECIES: integrase [unclassified Actinomyces]RAX20708.1 integrase [Actinomyces sp. Z3]
MVYLTRSKALRDVAAWIELTYDQRRLHSAIGYRTPNQFERELLQAATPKAA